MLLPRKDISFKYPVPSDGEISKSIDPVDIADIANFAGINEEEVKFYGKTMAKISLSTFDRLKDVKNGKYVVVTGINPTKLGEGKSTTLVGLGQALGAVMKKKSFTNLRQPSQGPTFNIKGGAAGGGYSQVLPIDDFNLHLTGDIHAVTAANNLIAAALLDSRIYHEETCSTKFLFKKLVGVKDLDSDKFPCLSQPLKRRLQRLGIHKTDASLLTEEEISRLVRLNVDKSSITWQRVLDVCDRHLRGVDIGLAHTERGISRSTGFDISVASEVMAILALSTSLEDLRERLMSVVVAYSTDKTLKGTGAPVVITVDDLGVAGAATALLKEALMPTLMQTVEGTPVFVHTGPFANIAHGNSSIIADKIALKLVGPDGYVVTEAGFGADIGFEKFCNIKSRTSGLCPDCVVLVATVRALKVHGGVKLNDSKLVNLEAVTSGSVNLKRHIQNISKFGLKCVVAINKFSSDAVEELDLIQSLAMEYGAFAAVIANHWEEGGQGARELAGAVIRGCDENSNRGVKNSFKLLYPNEMSIQSKIETIVKEIYGGETVEYSEVALQRIATYEKLGYGSFPICMAKTQYSFSANPALLGSPTGFSVNIVDIKASVGAQFLFPLCGNIQTIPGLAIKPAFFDIDVDTTTGEVTGLF